MKISSLISSLVDYPGTVCSTIFTIDCNLRCPFCYNAPLFLENKPKEMSIYLVFKKLLSRKKFTKYVCITGGEPSVYPDLSDFIRLLHNDGFKVKLDTNGLNPFVLEQCLKYLDYVAMDIKTSIKKYTRLDSRKLSKIKVKSKMATMDMLEFYYRNRLLESIKLIMGSKINYEFRTTVVPGLVDSEDILDIGSYISGCKKYIMQQFYPSNAYSKKYREIIPYPDSVFYNFKQILKSYKIEKIKILI
jgi:pyruvate formate lyase activating enzyme